MADETKKISNEEILKAAEEGTNANEQDLADFAKKMEENYADNEFFAMMGKCGQCVVITHGDFEKNVENLVNGMIHTPDVAMLICSAFYAFNQYCMQQQQNNKS